MDTFLGYDNIIKTKGAVGSLEVSRFCQFRQKIIPLLGFSYTYFFHIYIHFLLTKKEPVARFLFCILLFKQFFILGLLILRDLQGCHCLLCSPIHGIHEISNVFK